MLTRLVEGRATRSGDRAAANAGEPRVIKAFASLSADDSGRQLFAVYGVTAPARTTSVGPVARNGKLIEPINASIQGKSVNQAKHLRAT